MRIVVQKYGGSSLGSTELLRKVARKIVAEKANWDGIVVVVSAMEDTTDKLLALAYSLNPSPPERELDMLLTSGERIAMSLLSIAIWSAGKRATSYTGSQSGIITEDRHTGARILEVRASRIIESLVDGDIVIVAGFQGMSARREITTLGRGGSDTTAVALAVALGAERCEIYTDVPGVFTANPKLVKEAEKLDKLSYDEMLELAYAGADIVHPRAIELAKENKIPLFILSAYSKEEGSIIGGRGEDMEGRRVSGISSKRVLFLKFSFRTEQELDKLMLALQRNKVEVSQIHTAGGGTSASGLFTCWAPISELRRLRNLRDLEVIEDFSSVTIVGRGFSREVELVREVLNTLRARSIQPAQLFVTPLSVKFLVPREEADKLVRELHGKFIRTASLIRGRG